MGKGFICSNCHKFVSTDTFIGTRYRNHCPFCLWSTHVDFDRSGDRKANCSGLMAPVGLTFKHEGFDKYTGKPRQGEVMVIHRCVNCGHISINRTASDDNNDLLLDLLKKNNSQDEQIAEELVSENIERLGQKDEQEVRNQLFGKEN